MLSPLFNLGLGGRIKVLVPVSTASPSMQGSWSSNSRSLKSLMHTVGSSVLSTHNLWQNGSQARGWNITWCCANIYKIQENRVVSCYLCWFWVMLLHACVLLDIWPIFDSIRWIVTTSNLWRLKFQQKYQNGMYLWFFTPLQKVFYLSLHVM